MYEIIINRMYCRVPIPGVLRGCASRLEWHPRDARRRMEHLALPQQKDGAAQPEKAGSDIQSVRKVMHNPYRDVAVLVFLRQHNRQHRRSHDLHAAGLVTCRVRSLQDPLP